MDGKMDGKKEESSTNNNPQINLCYASIGRRFIALILDYMILSVPFLIGGSFAPLFGGILIWFLYAPVLESSILQATLGKYLMDIQVVDHQGGRLTFRTSVLRNLMKTVSSAIAFLGYFIAFFTEKRQSLHDLLADTYVVSGRSDYSVVNAWLEALKELFQTTSTVLPRSEVNKKEGENSDFLLNKLEKLQSLREKNIITEDEFQEQKKVILDKLKE